MAEHSSPSSPSHNQTRPISSFFNSPRFFTGFLGKSPIETEKLSPTSILDIKPPSPVSPHFTGTKHPWEKSDPIGVGLVLVDSLNADERVLNDSTQPKMVLFGSKLKVQIPPIPSSVLSPTGSPRSPADFGIKTRNSQVPGQFSPFGSKDAGVPQATFSRQLSVKEMELSEDYTCVISHGPNPKTTHIYDNCVVESCCGVVGLSDLEKKHCLSEDLSSPPESFLSFCCNCKKSLEQGKDIFMYRGEKAFCSPECRCQEMLSDEVENPK